MTDPHNIVRDKKVQQETRRHGKTVAPGANKTPQPGKKTQMENYVSDTPNIADEPVPISTEDKPLS